MEASKSEEEEALAALLDANGLTQGDVENASIPIQQLEMFLQHYPKMLGLQHFPHLTTLKLIDQCIDKIKGLSGCPKLQQLWLVENKVTKIEGLETCTGLRELYLYSNRISAIEGLDHLMGLQVLWLADNYISCISGLSRLQQLQQLNLARNDISTIGSSLLTNSALTSLNLADNKISSFQDIANLAKLAGLQELCLSDPFWGESPVAGLCNYQTFMLYLMPQLTHLDTLILADETKAAAMATFTKKQLYYNMRIRTLRRAAAGLVMQAKDGCKAHGSRWAQLLAQLARAVKGIERQLHQAAGTEQQALQEHLSNVQSAMQSVLSCHAVLPNRLTGDIQLSAAAVEDAVIRLQLELSSGGNIRLEEARPDESWLVSCQELLRNRLITAGEQGGLQGITDIQVVSVSRIHNRHLRLQFDRFVDKASENSRSNKQCTDYLFYGEHPMLPGELMRVAQNGFRCAAEYSSMGLDGAVRLANCVNLADQLRMQHALEAAAVNQHSSSSSSSGSGSHQRHAYLLGGQLLLCKVHLGGVLQEAEGRVQLVKAGTKLLGKDGSMQAAACLDGHRIEQQQYPQASAVYRTAATGPSRATSTASSSCQGQNDAAGLPQHRMWYLFDPAAALPEYLVTFRYTVKPRSQLALATAASGSNGSLEPQLCSVSRTPAEIVAALGGRKQQDPLLSLCARPLLPWLQLAAALPQQQGSNEAISQSTVQQLQSGAAKVEQTCTALLAAVVAAVPRQHITVLAPAALAAFAGAQQLSSLTYLSLHDCGLTSCDGLLSHLPCLSMLVLSFNKLVGLDGLVPCHNSFECQITVLDVSYNQIDSWQGRWLAGCCKLAALDASHNRLQGAQDLDRLIRSVPQLSELNLTGNPVQQSKAYKLHVSKDLHLLQQLDGKEAVKPTSANAALLPAVMQAGATQWHSDAGPTPVLQCQNTQLAEVWQPLLHSLVFEGKGLCSLSGLAAASRLVCASFADNMLTGLAGLQSCSQLRELNISSNLITELTPLSTLSSLQQLDVSFNSISSLMTLTPLTKLSQLSVEANQLSSLAGLAGMTGLLELYAANNAVSDIKEAERLAVLPRLVILDLVANPLVTACEDYRHLLLYRLRHLKVLDGVPAEAGELAAARAKYSGRLTMSFLEEQLGSSGALSAIRSLDVSSLRIRDVGVVFALGTPFASLAELVLDNNSISSLTALEGLTALQVLRMNNNRLGDAEPSCISFAAPAAPLMQSAASIQPQQQPLQPRMPNLQVLHIGGNGLTSLRPLQLQCLPALRSLFVQGNELQRLDGLEGLAHLRELVADKNKIRVLEADGLAPVVRLRELRLEDNLIKSLALAADGSPAAAGDSSSCAGCLPSLCVLQLGGNRLSDLNELERLCALPSLLELGLAGNPVARKQVYRTLLISRCTQLQVIDGQKVTAEEKEYTEAMFSEPPVDTTPLGAENALGLLAAVAADGRGAWAPLSVAPASSSMGLGSNSSFNRGGAQAGKLSAMALPAVINHDAFAQLAASSAGYAGNAAAVGAGGGLALPGVVSSVPSIQSGVLVLSGSAAFGLEGMSIGNSSSSNGRNASPAGGLFGTKQRPASVGRRTGGGGAIASGASGSPAHRRVTGPAYLGSGGGSPQRQVAYRGY